MDFQNQLAAQHHLSKYKIMGQNYIPIPLAAEKIFQFYLPCNFRVAAMSNFPQFIVKYFNT